jgi:hypothetical protein
MNRPVITAVLRGEARSFSSCVRDVSLTVPNETSPYGAG